MTLDLGHQGAGNALAAKIGMDQQFADLGAVRLVRRGIIIKLHRPRDRAVASRHQQQAGAVIDGRKNFPCPEGVTVFAAVRRNEANAGTCQDAGLQQFRKSIEMGRDVVA